MVPANPAYSERELAHIVSDVGAAAAIVEMVGGTPQSAALGFRYFLEVFDPNANRGLAPEKLGTYSRAA